MQVAPTAFDDLIGWELGQATPSMWDRILRVWANACADAGLRAEELDPAQLSPTELSRLRSRISGLESQADATLATMRRLCAVRLRSSNDPVAREHWAELTDAQPSVWEARAESTAATAAGSLLVALLEAQRGFAEPPAGA